MRFSLSVLTKRDGLLPAYILEIVSHLISSYRNRYLIELSSNLIRDLLMFSCVPFLISL